MEAERKQKSIAMVELRRKNHSDTGKVAEVLESAIRNGRLKPGERVDCVRNLASRLGVGMTAVMRALDKLEQKKLILRSPRRGIFVAGSSIPPARKILLLSDLAKLAKASAPSSYFIPHFERICQERNWQLDTIDLAFFSSIPVDRITRALSSKHYDGIVSLGSYYTGSENSLAALKRLNLPMVFPAAQPGDSDITGFPSLIYSSKETWKQALEYLIAAGYRSIGAIGNRNRTVGSCSLRCTQGEHMDILHSHGLDTPDRPVCYFDYSAPDDAREALRLFLENNRRFDAVLCYSDFHAAFVYDYCLTHRIRIPEDLAVMGIGCYTGWDLLSPKLTTLDFHYEKTAATTAEWLDDPPPPKTFKLWESEVIPGESILRLSGNQKRQISANSV